MHHRGAIKMKTKKYRGTALNWLFECWRSSCLRLTKQDFELNVTTGFATTTKAVCSRVYRIPRSSGNISIMSNSTRRKHVAQENDGLWKWSARPTCRPGLPHGVSTEKMNLCPLVLWDNKSSLILPMSNPLVGYVLDPWTGLERNSDPKSISNLNWRGAGCG